MAVEVLWLTKGLGPGGAERLLVETAGGIEQARVHVTAAYVLPYKDHLAGELERIGVTAVCLSRRRVDRLWPLRLRRLLRDGHFDVIHVHSPVPGAVARVVARTLPMSRRPQLVTTEHNTWTSHHPLTRWANRVTIGQDAAIFAVTDEVRASMRGAASRRAEVLTHGVDVDRIRSRVDSLRASMRATFGLDDQTIAIGTVANFRAQKDYPNLLRAVDLLATRYLRFRVLAVGQGPLEAEIIELRDELDLADHVCLLGFRSDAVDVMAACDVFVLASAWEGLPVAVMEALAIGLPIVATRVGGIAEKLDETCALLVEPGRPDELADALEAVIRDRRTRDRLAAGSAAAASRFDIGRAVDTLERMYSRFDRGADPPSLDEPRRRARARSAAQIRPATAGDRDAILSLLRASLGWGDGDDALYAWKHETNPFGPSYSWVAEIDAEVVAVRLFMRWELMRGDDVLRAVRAVDTATHPDHQGKGLFRALTLHGLEQCRADGIDFVFNTPNEQSRPGYLTMGWRELGRVPTAVRPMTLWPGLNLMRSRTAAERWSVPTTIGAAAGAWVNTGRLATLADAYPTPSNVRSLRTRGGTGFAQWRYGLDDLHYRVIDDGDSAIVVRLRRRGAGLELVVAESIGNPRNADAAAVRAARTVGASHVLRLGQPNFRHGFVPVPGGGPILTWRGLCDPGEPPLPNWDLQLRDIELF